ncbi:hypothetical protein D9M68_620590 [compost metagenome]
MVYRAENEKSVPNLLSKLTRIAKDRNTSFYPISSGYVEKGKDFGSSAYRLLSMPKVALVSSQEVSSQSAGQVWHFFEQELDYPLTLISAQSLNNLDIRKVNVLILPDGNYSDKIGEQLSGWLNSGGKLILMEDAINAALGKRPFDIKKKEDPKKEEKPSSGKTYALRDKDDLSNSIPGAIYKVSLDRSHPLTLGLGQYYYTLKTDDKIYDFLSNGWNVGTLKENSYIAGIAGEKIKQRLNSGLLFGVQPVGRGTIIYLGTDVLFRSFWENGKQLFINALFLVN